MTDRTIVGTGTAEADWARWPGWTSGRPVTIDQLLPGNSRLVVVAPHPDDETLAAGGLIQQAVASGRSVAVVAVTAGEASHPGSTRWPELELAAQRRTERAAALGQLGLTRPPVYELGIPDGAVSACVDEVIGGLRSIVTPADVLVGPWSLDGHPDHEATAEAVLACANTSYQAPIWGWHWAGPDELPPDGRLLELDMPAWQAKQRAVRCFTSQLEADPSTGADPILPDWALARWLRRTEVFFDGR